MADLNRYYLVFEPRKTAPPTEVTDTAARLGLLRFPAGYAEYVTELGEGTLVGSLEIWLPRRVEDQLPEHRQFLTDNFFWDEDGPLSPARAGETVLLGSTMDGDKLVFHPKQPDNLFFLPRHDDELHQVGPGLDAAIDWFCDSGVLTAAKSVRYFEPTGDRARITKSIACSYEVVRDAVLDLRIHDHVAFEECSEDEEEIYDIQVNVGGKSSDVEAESCAIMLLIKDIGGDVMVSTGSLLHPHLTDVSISYVADQKSMKLERLLGLLGELEARAGKSKRRR